MSRRKLLGALLAGLVVALLAGVGLWAYWTIGGVGSASATVGTLAAPTQVSGSSVPGSGNVSLAWTGVTAPDGGAVDGYYVTRSGTTSGPACGSGPGALLPAAPTSCSDIGLVAGTYAYVVVAVFRTWTATSAQSAPVTVVTDITPPTVSSIDRAGASPTSASSVQWTVTFSEPVTGVDASDFALAVSGLTGAAVTGVSGSGSTYTVTASTGSGNGTLGLDLVDDDSIVDGAGNPLGGPGAGNGNFTGAVYSVDKTPPTTPSLTLAAATGSSYISGSTVYTNPQAGRSGSFQVQATTADPESGIQKVSFPALSGFSAGGGDVSSSPYQTSYSWSGAGASASGAQTVTAYDNAGLSASASFTVTPDTTAPSVPAPTVAAGYVTALSVSVTLPAASDAGSGVDGSTLVLQRDQATLSGDSCAAFPGSWTTVTLSGGNDTSVASGSCYRYRQLVSDRVGNQGQSVASGTVKVDTSPPTTPSLTLAAATGSGYISGSTVYTNPQAGRSGSFQVQATTADPESGIQKVSFPALSGFSAGGGDVSSSPYQTSYSWSGAGASASGAQTVTAYDNAGLSASASFTVTPDTTAPTGGVLTVNGVQATSGGSSSANTTGSFPIDLRTDYADSESGLASSTLTRAYAADCSTYGSPTTISGAPAQSGLAPGCYRYTLTGTDNVGNQVSISTTVHVTAVLTITGAHDGGGSSKVKIGGTGGIVGGGTVTVVVCKLNSFPCSGANTAATLTATVASDGSWLTGASGNIGAGPFWARAAQGSQTSAVFGPFAPPYPP